VYVEKRLEEPDSNIFRKFCIIWSIIRLDDRMLVKNNFTRRGEGRRRKKGRKKGYRLVENNCIKLIPEFRTAEHLSP
jgi:hypothetical protein